MLVERFEDLDCWKLSRIFIKDVYLITSSGNFFRDYSLRDQFRRASVSIMLNIAEGFDADSDKSFQNFLRYSFRSASEVRSILYSTGSQLYK